MRLLNSRGYLPPGSEYRAPVAAPSALPSQSSRPDLALDGIAGALFVVFVGLLFLGYFDASFPYEEFALIPLVVSLAVVLWGNLRADRLARIPSANPSR